MDLSSKLEALLAEKFRTDEELNDCYVVEIEIKGNNRLSVFLDCDCGIDLEKCRVISRYLEAYLEENDWIDESYGIEVSSPGLSRPLKLLRQYERNVGRTIQVKYSDGRKLTGMLSGLTENGFMLGVEVKEKPNSPKQGVIQQQEVLFSEKAQVTVIPSMAGIK